MNKEFAMKYVKYLAVFFCIILALGYFFGKNDNEKIVKLLYMQGDWPITETEFNERYQAQVGQFDGAQINWLRIDKEKNKSIRKDTYKREIKLPQAQYPCDWISIITNEQNSHLYTFVISYASESNEKLKNLELNSYKAAIGAINPNMSKAEIDKYVSDLTEGKLEGELIGSAGVDSDTWKVYVKDNYKYSFIEEKSSNVKFHAISYSICYVDERNFTSEMKELYNAHIKTMKK